MATPTTIDTDTELSAVNSILGAIGQAPVTTLGTVDEITGELSYTAAANQVAFSLSGLSWVLLKEVKATIDGVQETNFTVSGSTLTFTSAPGVGTAVRIYTEKEKYNTLANPEVSFIYNILTEVNKDVQNEGWIFNIERHKKIQRSDINSQDKGIIEIPSNILRYDLHAGLANKTQDLVRRKINGQYVLYDTVNHTERFSEDLYLDIVYLWPYDDLPSVFKRYIATRASVRAATQLVTNPQLVQLLQQQEAFARANCLEYECQQGDHSYFGHGHDTFYTSFQPSTALRR